MVQELQRKLNHIEVKANRIIPRQERLRKNIDELTGPREDALRIEALYELTLRHWRGYQNNRDWVLEAIDDDPDDSYGHKLYTDGDAKQLDVCVRDNFSEIRKAVEYMERYLLKIDKKYRSIRKRIQKMNK